MEQSPSWEANRSSACQEIPRILRNPKVTCRIHNWLLTVPILSQINPDLSFPSHFLKIHCNVIHPYMLTSSNWYSSLESVYQNPVCTSPVPHTFHMSCPSYTSLSWLPERLLRSTEHKTPLYSVSPLTCHLAPLKTKYLHQRLTLEHPQPLFLPQREWPSLTPIQTTGKTTALYILIFIFLDSSGSRTRNAMCSVLPTENSVYTDICTFWYHYFAQKKARRTLNYALIEHRGLL